MVFPRYHLFELHELAWCPEDLRLYMMTILVSGWHLPTTLPILGGFLNARGADNDNDRHFGSCRQSSSKPSFGLLKGFFHCLRGCVRSPVEIVADVMDKILIESRCTHIIDLCSGAGGPIPTVCALIHQRRCQAQSQPKKESECSVDGKYSEIRISCTLTDLYPPPKSVQRDIVVNSSSSLRLMYYPHSVDATRVPADITTLLCGDKDHPTHRTAAISAPLPRSLRTIMGAFHHFTPASASSVLKDTVNKGDAICIVEMTHRSLLSMVLFTIISLAYGFIGPLLDMLPYSLTRVFFTYVVPLYPLAVTWDSVVSCVRSFSEAEWEGMVMAADPESKYMWSYRQHRIISWFPYFFATTYTGYPKD